MHGGVHVGGGRSAGGGGVGTTFFHLMLKGTLEGELTTSITTHLALLMVPPRTLFVMGPHISLIGLLRSPAAKPFRDFSHLCKVG
jgi:hypothetical protein